MRRLCPLALLALLTVPLACDDPPTLAGPESGPVHSLEVVEGEDQRFFSGRRSPGPFAVRVRDEQNEPLADARVRFTLTGEAGGTLSQPVSFTDGDGRAETFLLESTPGDGVLTASSGGTQVEIAFQVDRGPDEIRFLEGTGEVGLPGLPHPDSLIRVQVMDTEGEPLEGAEVWFSAPGKLSTFADTTDARGRASTVLRRSGLNAGTQPVFAFMVDFQRLTVRTERPTAPAAERVVMISIDGLRADALERFQPPTLTRLANEGAFTDRAETVLPSLTVPAHLSMLSGVAPATHGVLNDRIRLTPEMTDLQPLFRKARDRGRTAVAFMSGEGPLQGFDVALGCKLAFGLDSLTLVPADGFAVADSAAASLADPEIELLFLHLPDADIAGHAHGWSSEEYKNAVFRADSALERIVTRATEGAGEDQGSVLVMVVSDHGGGGAYGDHLHGSSSPEDVRIPVILWGSGVVPGRDLSQASILDMAPTVLWSLGIAPPIHYQGEILTEAFR